MTLEQIVDDMQQAIAARKRDTAPHKGMHVPYYGALCSANPSVLRDVQWWVNELRKLVK